MAKMLCRKQHVWSDLIWHKWVNAGTVVLQWKIKCTSQQQRNKRGYQLVTEGVDADAAAAAVCAMKSDSPISDLLLSVHLNGCRQHSDIHLTHTDRMTGMLDLTQHSLPPIDAKTPPNVQRIYSNIHFIFFSQFLKEFTTSSSFDSQKQMKLLQDCQERTNPGFVPAEILFLGAILFTAACLNAERDTERERIQNGCGPRLSHRVFAVFDGPLQEAGETALHYSVRTADQTSLHLVDFLVQNRYFSKSFSPTKKKLESLAKLCGLWLAFHACQTAVMIFFKHAINLEENQAVNSSFCWKARHQIWSACLLQAFLLLCFSLQYSSRRAEESLAPLGSHSHKANRNGSSTFLLCLNLFLSFRLFTHDCSDCTQPASTETSGTVSLIDAWLSFLTLDIENISLALSGEFQ